MLSNPYPYSSSNPEVKCRISSADYVYFRQLFPVRGTLDRALGSLVHELISQLRASGLDANNPDHRAWFVDHPSYTILSSAVERICGNAVGRSNRDQGPRPEPTTVNGVCPALCDAAEQCPDEERGTPEGSRSDPEDEVPQAPEGGRGLGQGVVVQADRLSSTLLEKLKLNGIL